MENVNIEENQLFEIKNIDGEVIVKMKNPTVVYDIIGTVLKIGEKEEVEKYYEEIIQRYKNHNFNEIIKDIHLMELPHNQEIINNVYHITGYIKKLHNKITTH